MTTSIFPTEVKQVNLLKNEQLSEMNIRRTLFFFDGFYSETAEELVSNLISLDAESNEDITICINSYGGVVTDLFAIIDTINNLKSNVNTVVLGAAYSCGAVLASCGKKRKIGKNSKMMIHNVQMLTYGSINDVTSDIVRATEMNEKLVDFMSSKAKISREQLKALMDNESFLTAEKCVEIGLADEVLDASKSNLLSAISPEIINAAIKAVNEDDYYAKVIHKESISKRKEDNSLDKDSLINSLKEFNIDVPSLVNKLSELEVENKLSVEKINELKNEAEKAKEEVAKEKETNRKMFIENTLSKLIDEGKSTQIVNETVYSELFSNMSIEEITAKVTVLPTIIDMKKETLESDSPKVVEEKELNEEYNKITAYAKEHNISFSKAEYQLRYKKEE